MTEINNLQGILDDVTLFINDNIDEMTKAGLTRDDILKVAAEYAAIMYGDPSAQEPKGILKVGKIGCRNERRR